MMMLNELYLKEESYKIIGKGHSEKVYGDACRTVNKSN